MSGELHPKNPAYAERVAQIFKHAAFVQHLGIHMLSCGPGWCESELAIRPEHLQQDQFIHAGVQATLADHTAGAAAGTLMGADEIVLTVEFKINLLRPAIGERLRARAEVLRAGRTLIVVESSVLDAAGRLAAKAMVTMALVPAAKH